MAIQRIPAVLAVAACALACTHTIIPQKGKFAPAELRGTTTKRVAVVIAAPNVQEVYANSVGGFHFNVHGMQEFYQDAIVQVLKDRVGSIQIFDRAPPPGFDRYVYLEAEVLPDNTSCKAKLAVSVVSRQGRTLSREQAEGAQEFLGLGHLRAACFEAVSASFHGAAYEALRMLEDPESPSHPIALEGGESVGQTTPTAVTTPVVPAASSRATCRSDADCPGDHICERGQCSPPTPVAPLVGSCSVDRDCPGGQLCNSGVCAMVDGKPASFSGPPGDARRCGKDIDCEGDLVCINRLCALEK